MERTSWPRHKVRVYGQASPSPDHKRTDYIRLLNFLARNTSLCKNAILNADRVPEFAAVRTILNQRIKTEPGSTGYSEELPEPSPVDLVELPPESLECNEPESIIMVIEETGGKQVDGGTASVLENAATMLEQWFSSGPESQSPQARCSSPATSPCNDVDGEGDFEDVGARYAPVRALATNSDNHYDDEPQQGDFESARENLLTEPGVLLSQLEKIARTSSSPAEENAPVAPEKRTASRSRSRRSRPITRSYMKPCLIPLANGTRKEIFSTGACLIKDDVGRVRKVKSQDNVEIVFEYDQKGTLSSFMRTGADGSVHSRGERDRHGVIVRDAQGRVRAQGESMSVDTRGCLNVRKMDGQFWCVDVVRGIHIERRILEDMDGNWKSLTALFAYDGFRMVTRFQALSEGYRRYGDWLINNNCGVFRFYGRDGSMIQFNSDEDLKSVRPAKILSAGTFEVYEEHRLRRQARTGWDAYHEYVCQYLSTL